MDKHGNSYCISCGGSSGRLCNATGVTVSGSVVSFGVHSNEQCEKDAKLVFRKVKITGM